MPELFWFFQGFADAQESTTILGPHVPVLFGAVGLEMTKDGWVWPVCFCQVVLPVPTAICGTRTTRDVDKFGSHLVLYLYPKP